MYLPFESKTATPPSEGKLKARGVQQNEVSSQHYTPRSTWQSNRLECLEEGVKSAMNKASSGATIDLSYLSKTTKVVRFTDTTSSTMNARYVPCDLLIQRNFNKDDPPDRKEGLTRSDINKMHLQLRHPSATALNTYIRVSRMWTDEMTPLEKEVIDEFPCRAAFPPAPHANFAPRPPTMHSQAHRQYKCITKDGFNFSISTR